MKQADLDSVKFVFEVKNHDELFNLTDKAVRLAIRKPSGLAYFQDCTVTDPAQGICEITLVNQAYNESGLHSGELHITEGAKTAVTRQFEYISLGSITP